MEGVVITIGVTLIKLGAVGGFTASVVAGIKWFAKFDPNFKSKKAKLGGDDDDSGVEHLRNTIRSRS